MTSPTVVCRLSLLSLSGVVVGRLCAFQTGMPLVNAANKAQVQPFLLQLMNQLETVGVQLSFILSCPRIPDCDDPTPFDR